MTFLILLEERLYNPQPNADTADNKHTQYDKFS